MQDPTSSPDPLNDSATYYSPRKTRRATRQSLPARSSSPTKQTFELDVGNKLSPQKLIVTVEAESDGGYTRNHVVKGQPSPSRRPNKTKERTTTTIIPVKGLSDSEEEALADPTPKKGRGRPRKSTGTPVPTKKGRHSTPTRRKSIGDLIDGDDEDDVNYQFGKNVEVGRGKGKSRSRSTKGASRKSTPAPEMELDQQTTTKKGRGRPRKKSVVLDEPVVREDSVAASIQEDFPGQDEMSESRPILERDGSFQDRTPLESLRSSPRDLHFSNRPRQGNNAFISPSLPPGNITYNANREHGIGFVPDFNSEGRKSSPAQESVEQIENEEEEEEDDEVGELREFDTILESEQFSMISVDSVPSLRNLSSPALQENQPLPTPTNKVLEHLRDATTLNDSFSNIPEEVLIAATPARRVLPRNLSVPATVDNSFSSIPPEILAAATPATKRLASKLQSAQTIADDSFSTIAPEILQAATPARVLPKKQAHIAPRSHISAYGDDYSTSPAVSSGVPALPYHRQDSSKSHRNEASNGPEKRRVVSASHSTTSRLLTPVGSSPESESIGHASKLDKAAMRNAPGRMKDNIDTHELSLMHSYMPSSPPLAAPEQFTYTAHLRRHSQLDPDVTHTPSIVFSSPSLPPPINGHREQAALKSDFGLDQKVVSSPVARAGQALQNILAPSSPRSRSASLGSPFKSPAADRKSSSVSRAFLPSPSQERGIKHLPRLDWNNNPFAGSQTSSSAHQARQDDPFSNYGVVQQRSPSPEEDLKPYKLGVPGKSRAVDSRALTMKSADLSMSDDAMSWQAEAEVPVPNSSSSARREPESMEQKWAKERAAVSKQINSANPERVIVIESDDEDAIYEPVDDDEDLGLLLETINSSSPAQPQEERSSYVEKPRRSKIPSPWRKNSKRLVYSDELSHFSSPAALPEVSVSKGFARVDRSQPLTVRRIVTPILSDEVDPVNLSNWQIPQKANFQPRVRDTGKLDLSALLSPVKPLPILPRGNRPASFESTSASSAGLQNIISTKPAEELAEPRVRRDEPFAPIPQKMGFNPTPRNSSPLKVAPTQGIFSNISKSHLFTPSAEETSTAPSQDRSPLLIKNNQTLNRAHQDNTPSSTTSSTISYPVLPQEQDSPSQQKENPPTSSTSKPENRTLKWTQSLHLATKIIQTPLPDRTISPTKSCFPLRTPQVSPSKNVQFVSSSPVPPSPEQTLSATEWSRKHWLLLESILQAHQAEEEALRSGKAGKEGRRRRNSTRVISRLLGKKVSSQGEEMFFEQWHLEVVDEFRGIVPGWEEKTIAMRVFALIVGAERRRLGLID